MVSAISQASSFITRAYNKLAYDCNMSCQRHNLTPSGNLMTEQKNIEAILDQLEARYDSLRRPPFAMPLPTMPRRASGPTPPSAMTAPSPTPSYGSNMIRKFRRRPRTRAFARLNQPGIYTASIARPALFRDYLREQLEHLSATIRSRSASERRQAKSPTPMCSTAATSTLRGISTAELSRWFPSTDLVHIGDEVADGAWDVALDPTRPLALFDALADRFQPGPAEALHRNADRAFPALRAVHQLCPLCR